VGAVAPVRHRPSDARERPALAVRRVPLGALTLEVRVHEASLLAAAAGAFAGYDPNGLAGTEVLTLDVGLGAVPRPGLPELPRLALGSDGLLRDDSEGWELTLDPTRAHAVAELRRWREDEELWRLQLEALCRVVAASLAPARGGALVHGVALVAPGHDVGLVFVGESGQGKTTLARRLAGWTLLADDTVWVGRDPGGAYLVGGTPFAGKERLPRRGRLVRLGGLAVLAPHRPLALEPLEPGPAFAALIARAMGFAPGWGSGAQALWDLLGGLVQGVPARTFASTLEDDVEPVLRAWSATLEGAC